MRKLKTKRVKVNTKRRKTRRRNTRRKQRGGGSTIFDSVRYNLESIYSGFAGKAGPVNGDPTSDQFHSQRLN